MVEKLEDKLNYVDKKNGIVDKGLAVVETVLALATHIPAIGKAAETCKGIIEVGSV